MFPSVVNIEHAKRANIIRDANNINMQLVCKLAKKVENNDVLPLFCAWKMYIESIINYLHVEKYNVIDLLIEPGCNWEYESDYASVETHMLENYYYII